MALRIFTPFCSGAAGARLLSYLPTGPGSVIPRSALFVAARCASPSPFALQYHKNLHILQIYYL